MSDTPSDDSLPKDLAAALARAIKPFQTLQKSVSAGLRRVSDHIAKLNDAIGPILRELAELGLTAQQYPVVMYALGWPPVDCFTTKEQLRIIDAYNREPEQIESLRATIEKAIISRYDGPRLDAMVAHWRTRPLLKRRMNILEQAVHAHVEGRYALTVPTVLAQLEGLIADGFVHHGKMYLSHYKGYLGRLLSPELLRRHDETVKDFMVKVILAGFEHGNPLPSNVSRHAILHGADTTYDTVEYSLKTVLLFDYVQGAFELFGTPHGKSYHLLGCIALSRTGSERIIFKSEFEAVRAGRRPCKRCHPSQYEVQASACG